MTAELEENSSNPLRILFKEEKNLGGCVLVFIAALRLSLVTLSGGYSSLWWGLFIAMASLIMGCQL